MFGWLSAMSGNILNDSCSLEASWSGGPTEKKMMIVSDALFWQLAVWLYLSRTDKNALETLSVLCPFLCMLHNSFAWYQYHRLIWLLKVSEALVLITIILRMEVEHSIKPHIPDFTIYNCAIITTSYCKSQYCAKCITTCQVILLLTE